MKREGIVSWCVYRAKHQLPEPGKPWAAQVWNDDFILLREWFTNPDDALHAAKKYAKAAAKEMSK